MYPHQYPQYYYPAPMYNNGRMSSGWNNPIEVEQAKGYNSFRSSNIHGSMLLKDYGPQPYVVNINEATKQNNTYRTALWTGEHLQVTLMSLNVGEDIGLEIHPNVDQFLRIEQGQGIVQMGKSKENLKFERNVHDDSAIMIPAGTWHNVTNTGTTPLKLYSIYAPPNHPFGTVPVTKADAMATEDNHGPIGNTVISGKTPDEWIQYTEFLVNEGLEDVKRGINATHILQEFILMGVLVGKGYTPEKAYETVEEWERTGESKLLQQSKKMRMNSSRTTNSNSPKTSFSKEEAAAIALLLGIDFTKSEFGLDEFWMGVNTELEHGRKYNLTNVTADDPITTGKIALAHLTEFPDYYQRLKVFEEEAKAYWNK